MEDEAQKMVALKKAYADIILNTAKEAAARIMVSERKALRFQQDLCAAKEEGLRMLVRLKQMIDSKTTEAELMSLSQQRKIEELEAQLQEAEDVITDLRAELKQMGDELEKVKKNQVQPLNGQTAQEYASFSKNLAPFSSSGCETMETSDMKNMPVNQRLLDDKCCSTMKETERLSASDLDNYDPNKSDLASIIMRSKKPELYRNGCTQRIRAFERNLLEGNLPPSGYDSGNSLIDNEIIIKASEKEVCNSFSLKCEKVAMNKKSSQGERKKKIHTLRRRKTRFGKAKTLRRCHHVQLVNITKTSDGLQENLQNEGCNNKDEVKITYKGKRKRNVKSGNSVDASSTCPPGQLTKPCQPSPVLSRCRTFSYLVNGGIKSVEGQSTTCELDKVKPVAAKKDMELMDERLLMNRENDVDESNIENNNVSSINCDSDNTKASERLNESPRHADNSRLLKYTFQRKRKKEAISSPDEIASPEKSSVKRKTVEEDIAAEPHKSSVMDESSRDSRRLAQVARQLISLSGRRWW